MAVETSCQTPGVVFDTHIQPAAIEIRVRLPEALDLTARDAEILEANIHNALELVLGRYVAA